MIEWNFLKKGLERTIYAVGFVLPYAGYRRGSRPPSPYRSLVHYRPAAAAAVEAMQTRSIRAVLYVLYTSAVEIISWELARHAMQCNYRQTFPRSTFKSLNQVF